MRLTYRSLFGLVQGVCERGTGVDLNVNEDAERTNNAEIRQKYKATLLTAHIYI